MTRASEVSTPAARGCPRVRTRSAPEDSVSIRVVVAILVLVAMGAVIAQGAVDPITATAALVLAPAGYAYSYRRRHGANVGTKAILVLGLLVAFGAFLQDVRGAQSVDDARVSLAGLFLWVQVLHSFDVPRRRDLAFSVVSSLILMAEAATLSFDVTLLVFLVPYAALGGLWLFLSSAPPPGRLTPSRVRIEPAVRARGRAAGSLARTLVAVTLAVIMAAAVVFFATPRLPGAVVAAPPFALGQRVPVARFDGRVVNPGSSALSDPSAPRAFEADAYPGFGEGVDLRSRGELGDRIVFRVRAAEAALWRGQTYDVFDGTRWSASDPTALPIGREDQAFRIPAFASQPDPEVPRARLLQTFYVETRQPNVVFGAYLPTEVYFPTNTLHVDEASTIRSPILLEQGMVYSVISEIPAPTHEQLWGAPARWPRQTLRRFTQLPASTTDRVRALAHRIADGEPTVAGKVAAVESWLRRNTRYDLSVPSEPPGADPIDTFLFDRRRGYCEHIATAMVVLLREAGVPARLVVGFGPGERNLLTGYLEVRERDAHAWVEVLYPRIGWIAYDPTFGVPEVAPGLGDRFVASRVLRALGALVAGIVPEPVKATVAAVGRATAAAARGAFAAWPAPLAVSVLGAAAAFAWRRARAARRRGPRPTGAAAVFVALEDVLASGGLERPAHRTPEEHLAVLAARRALADDALADATTVVRTFERERFSPASPTGSDVGAARAAVERLRATVRPSAPPGRAPGRTRSR